MRKRRNAHILADQPTVDMVTNPASFLKKKKKKRQTMAIAHLLIGTGSPIHLQALLSQKFTRPRAMPLLAARINRTATSARQRSGTIARQGSVYSHVSGRSISTGNTADTATGRRKRGYSNLSQMYSPVVMANPNPTDQQLSLVNRVLKLSSIQELRDLVYFCFIS